MSAEELVRYLADAGFLGLFALTLVEAIRRPSRGNLDTTLFFGAIAIVIAIALGLEAAGGEPPALVTAVQASLIMALPYLVLRLARDFTDTSLRVLRSIGVVLLALVVPLFLVEQPYPSGYALLLVAFFVGVAVYAATRFLGTTRTASNVIRRRMQAVALGSVLLGAVILVAGFGIAFPDGEGIWTSLTSALVLASGLSYYIGFATPAFLRRAWRASDVRRFMAMAIDTSQMEDSIAFAPMVASLEEGIAAVLGAPRVMIIPWDEASERLVTPGDGERGLRAADRESTPAYRAFREQRAYLIDDAARADPANADVYRRVGAKVLLVAPVTSNERRLGVLAAFGRQSSLFAEDDLVLVSALANQVATLLVVREVLARTADVRAREEANRLKEEFLSAAAHDLKTPLTTLLGQAQLMQRRLRANAEYRPDAAGIGRMVGEAQRMRRLVDDLLDASRTEQGGFVGEMTAVDVYVLARDVAQTTAVQDHEVVVTGERAVANADEERVRQVLQNLVGNAMKYSPGGGLVRVAVAPAGAEVLLSVSDDGIGIPREELSLIFERFQRGSRANDRRFGGMGVGLYLCRRIVEEHGGRIWAESTDGHGSQFYVALPRCEQEGE